MVDQQTQEREVAASARVHKLEADVAKLEAALRRAEADRDLYASQLLDAEGRRLSTACDLVQDTLNAHAVMAISSLSEDEWVLELERDPEAVMDGKQFSGASLFEAIQAMQVAAEKGGDHG